MEKKIVIGGGTGFVGSYCTPRLQAQGYRVIIISRSGDPTGQNPDLISWDDTPAIVDAVDGAEIVMNLAGKSVDCRYNDKNKAVILSSRVDTTRAIGEAIYQSKNPTPLWLNASTATIYRDAMDRPMTEEDGELGSDFSVSVARQWEDALHSADLPSTRRVALRIAIALGNGYGLMPPSKMLVRFGMGGKHGDGQQKFSWIHIEDLYRAILFIRDTPAISGPVNAVAPNPVNNEIFMRTLRQKMNMPIGIPHAKWMLEIGAFFLRTETELLLKSRWVLPKKLQDAGFEFQYGNIDAALEELLKKSPAN